MVRERATQTKKELMQHPGWVLNATISRSIPTWYNVTYPFFKSWGV